MKHAVVLKQGLLSEKIYNQMKSGIYTFMVSKEATKEDIKKAVETQFATKVKKVNVIAKPSKQIRVTGTRKMVQTGSGKKAVVFLEKGQSIAMLAPKSEAKKSKELKKETKSTTDTKSDKPGILSRIKKNKEAQEGKNK